MHNGLMCDPTNPFSIRIKKIVSKGTRKMTTTDYEERDRLQWEGGLYWSEKDGPIIPSDNIERCIQLGAQKSRAGKDVQAAVFCTTVEAKLNYVGPRNMEKLYESKFLLRKPVVINKSRVICIRPMFPTGWWIEFELEFDNSILNESKIVEACNDAGALIGLGDWRPKFGRFLSEKI